MDLYSETILDHYQNPHHGGSLPNPTVTVVELNPLCGDSIQLDLRVKNGAVEDIGFTSSGCAISQAAMSLLSDEIIGKKISALAKLKPQKIYDLLQVPISPGRVKCALLGLVALQQAIKKAK
ncbi:MAG: iron-sulfur cluster assembly scaffold protein [bacterium]|nr:iron-sulfur cluster assembly scaffold protein [bacterium]